PAEIREGFEDQLVTLARGGESAARGDDAPRSIERERERRRFARPMRLLAGVVAAALIVGAGVGGYLLAPKETTAQALGRFLQQHENAQTLPLTGSANGVMSVVYA